jgi:hypothetical protein
MEVLLVDWTEKDACGQYDILFIADLAFIQIHNT